MLYRYVLIAAVIAIAALSSGYQAMAGKIEGVVCDAQTGELISQVNVIILNTKIGTSSNMSGAFILKGLHEGDYTLKFSFIGYTDKILCISLETDEYIAIVVKLSPTILRTENITITTTRGFRDRFECPLATEIVSRDMIEQRNVAKMDEAFQQIPGVSLSTTGPGSVRPVIRGLYDVHILTLLNGIPMNDLRPGGNHVMLIEPAQIERMEIVKGPGSVLYGSDAVGGLVNFITMPHNPFSGKSIGFTGKFHTGYASNGGLYQGIAEFAIGRETSFIKGRFGRKYSDNISDPTGEIPNSSYEGDHIDLMGGLSGDFADIDLVYHYLIADVGVPINPVIQHSVFEDEKQQFLKLSNTIKPSLEYIPAIEMNLSWQRHNRHFHMIKPFEPDPANFDQDMQIFVNTDAYNFQVIPSTPISEKSLLKYGVDILYQTANSDRKSFKTSLTTGEETIMNPSKVIPDSRRTDAAFFVQNETDWQSWLFFAGGRYDWVNAESEQTENHPIESSKTNHGSFSGNIGAVYHLLNNINITGQVGRAFRSPTLLELYFWGPHQTTVDIGNPDLEPEMSLNFDLGVNQRQERYEWSVNVFYNTIQNYINKQQTGITDSATGLLIDSWENLSDVRLLGGEAAATIYLTKEIGIFGSVSYVEGTDIETDEPLPDIPPFNGNLGIRYSDNLLSSELSAIFASEQNRIVDNETGTDGYTVFNSSLGLKLERWLKVKSRLNLAITNIFDVKYHNHLSRTKQWYYEPSRNMSLSLTIII